MYANQCVIIKYTSVRIISIQVSILYSQYGQNAGALLQLSFTFRRFDIFGTGKYVYTKLTQKKQLALHAVCYTCHLITDFSVYRNNRTKER